MIRSIFFQKLIFLFATSNKTTTVQWTRQTWLSASLSVTILKAASWRMYEFDCAGVHTSSVRFWVLRAWTFHFQFQIHHRSRLRLFVSFE
jgi:hypothetical protein